MATCKKCGAVVADNEVFCPVCGAAMNEQADSETVSVSVSETVSDGVVVEEVVVEEVVSNETSEEVIDEVVSDGKKTASSEAAKKVSGFMNKIQGMNKKVLIGAVMAIVLVIIILCVALSGGSPASKVKKAFVKTYTDALEEGLPKVIMSVLNGGSIELNVGDESNSANLVLSTDLSKKAAALDVLFKQEGEKLLEGNAYIDTAEVSADIKNVTGKAYGISLKDAAKNLPKSIFNPENDSMYSLPQSVYDQIIGTLTANKDVDATAKDVQKTALSYMDFILETVFDKGEVTTESEEYTIGEKDVKCEKITLSVDGPKVSEILKAVVKKVKGDKDLKKLAVKVFESAPALYLRFRSTSPEEAVDSLWEELDALDEDFYENITASEDTATLTLYIGKSSDTIVAGSVKTRSSYGTSAIKLVLGENLSTSPVISFDVKDNDDPYMSVSYRVSEDDKTSYSSKLSVKSYDEEQFAFKFNWDKSAKTYNATASIYSYWYGGMEDYLFYGSFDMKNKNAAFTVEAPSIMGQGLVISVDLSDSGKVKSQSYKDVLTMKEEDVDELVERISNSDGIRNITRLFDFY